MGLSKNLLSLQEGMSLEGGQTSHLVHQVFLSLWTVKWTVVQGNSIPDPTMRALVLMSVKSDGGVAEADEVTCWIARYENAVRLTSLFEIKELSRTRFGGDDSLACDEVQPWFVEKVYSTFNSLRTLQHRATAIAYGMTSMPKVWWVDRENWTSMLYRGHHLTLDMLRQAFRNLEDAIVRVWEEDVLCGLDLHVDYDILADDLANTDVHYSFLVDPRNASFRKRDLLLTAVLKDDKLRDRFAVARAEGDGYTLNSLAFHGWLRLYARFQQLRLVRSEMLSGGPSRSTELTCMNYCNTDTRPTRNCLALGRHLGMQRLYSKVGGSKGNDRRIPHSLDAVTKDLTIQDLALARPFAEIAIHLCHPERSDVQRLYREELFVNGLREFNVKDLSNGMKEFTRPVMGVGLGVNAFRHVEVAFERKRCGKMTKLVEGEENETMGALLAGHSRKVENRVYGLSPDVLAGPAEDVMPLYLEGSTELQVEWRVVPGGLPLSYKQARHHHFEGLVSCGQIKLGRMDRQRVTPDLDHLISGLAAKMGPMLKDAMSDLVKREVTSALGIQDSRGESNPLNEIFQTASDIFLPILNSPRGGHGRGAERCRGTAAGSSS